MDSLELARISDLLRRPVSWFLVTPSPAVVSRRTAREGVELEADVVLESLASAVEQLVEWSTVFFVPKNGSRSSGCWRDRSCSSPPTNRGDPHQRRDLAIHDLEFGQHLPGQLRQSAARRRV